MVAFDEALHRRDGGGRFTHKVQEEAVVSLSDGARLRPPLTRSGEPVRTVNSEGRVEWRTDEGYLHREGGPAVEKPGGYEQWWNHGVLHRDGGPAVTNEDGSQEWWVDGHYWGPWERGVRGR